MNVNKKIAGVVLATFAFNTPVFAQIQHAASIQKPFAEELINVGQQQDVRAQLAQQLKDAKVVAELEKMGVNKGEAQQRIAAMTDSELNQVAQGVHREAGGEVIVISLGVALLIILIVVLLFRSGGSGGGGTTVVR